MPIRGLSTREDTTPRFPIIGKLRKGGPKQGKRFGPDLDHFRFTSDDPEIEQEFHRIYGAEPDFLQVYLPFDTMEDNFSSWREQYGANGLVKIRCDGENWVNWVDGPRYMRGQKPCPFAYKDTGHRCPKCELAYVGRLSVILEPLWRAGHIGLVTLETHSINDIGRIAGKLVQHEPLTGKEFALFRRDTRIGVPIKNRRAAVEKSLVYIELSQRWMVAQLEAAQDSAYAMLNGHAPRLPEHSEPDAPTGMGHEPPEPPMQVEPEEEGEVIATIEAEADTPDEVIEVEPYHPVLMPSDMESYEDIIAWALKVDEWTFQNPGEVMTALVNYDKQWKGMALDELWAALNDHQASARVAEAVPA